METVNLRRGAADGAELRIELNRPDAMNAWDRAVRATTCCAAVEEAAADDAVRAVVDHRRRAAAFSSGADLKAGFDPTPEGHPGRPDARCTSATTRSSPASGEMPKPVLAAVNGPAVGHRLLARAGLRPGHRRASRPTSCSRS